MNVFEKFHAQEPGYDSVLLIRPPNPNTPPCDDVVLFLTNGRGNDILAVTADGQMHFALGYTPTQQAEAFRQAVNMLSQRAVFPLVPAPVGVPHPDKLL